MKISEIKLSVLALPSSTPLFSLDEEMVGTQRRWQRRSHGPAEDHIHVLHVRTDEGVEGVCTVGDARYTAMRPADLAQLRLLAIGEDPFDRERLDEKLRVATRGIFSKEGWFGAFDNCLWDIAGKVAGLPVYALLGRARASAPAYYNFHSATLEAALHGAQVALDAGFVALKDHFSAEAETNIAWCRAVRETVGAGVELLHDAAGCVYTVNEALRVGRALDELRYGWFEEPLPDRNHADLQKLCTALDIPILAPETLMHDQDLCAHWLISGATDLLRANARHGVTQTMKLAHLAELHNTTIELNGPGGLFGLVHAHLCVAIRNTSYYEYFPGGSRDEAGREIGLLNPPVPQRGQITPPDAPGWGAEWDWAQFRKKVVAEL